MLFEHSEKRRLEDIKIYAAMHGVKMNGNKRRSKEIRIAEKYDYNGDPESVAHLSQDQREALTKNMMADFKKVFGDNDA